MGTTFDFVEQTRCVHYEHDCQSNRQNCMLVKTVDGWVGLKFLFDLAKGSTKNSRK